MDKRIVFTRADGGLSVLGPAPQAQREDESDDDFIARIIEKDVPKDASGVRVVDVSEIPADRTFRNAWQDGGGRIVVDLDMAREIVRQRIREWRAPRLAALDVAYLRAVEAGDAAAQARIAAEKQALRAATANPAIAAAETIEALRALLPGEGR